MNRIHPTMKACYDSCLPGQNAVKFSTDFLLLGYSAGTAWFLEFAADGQVNWHQQAQFCAVGSGGTFATVARALLSHYLEGDPLTLELGMKVAYRTIETTCAVSSAHVSLPVQMAVVDAHGTRLVQPEEIEELKEAVAGWKLLERETLSGGGSMASGTDLSSLPSIDDEGKHEEPEPASPA